MGVEDKAYLEVAQTEDGPAITARKEHAAELKTLYEQRGVPSRVEPDTGEGRDTLVFHPVSAAAAAEVLEAYKTAKGS